MRQTPSLAAARLAVPLLAALLGCRPAGFLSAPDPRHGAGLVGHKGAAGLYRARLLVTQGAENSDGAVTAAAPGGGWVVAGFAGGTGGAGAAVVSRLSPSGYPLWSRRLPG